jgi:hypothetical protein
LFSVLAPRNVRVLEDGFSSRGLYRANRSLPSGLVELCDDHMRTRFSQTYRDGFANPAAGSGHYSYSAIQAQD